MDTDAFCDTSGMLQNLEQLEIEGGELTHTDYESFLALYLAINDLPNAKFLWKRIPDSIKEHESSCLEKIWELGKALIRGKYSTVYDLVDNSEWPPHLVSIMSHLRKALVARNLQLIVKSYSSLRFEDAMKMIGSKTKEELLKLSEAQGWTVCPSFGFIISRKTGLDEDNQSSNNEQLEKLADYVSFLENY